VESDSTGLRKSRATDYFNCRNGLPREHSSQDRLIGTCCLSEADSYAELGQSSPITSELHCCVGGWEAGYHF